LKFFYWHVLPPYQENDEDLTFSMIDFPLRSPAPWRVGIRERSESAMPMNGPHKLINTILVYHADEKREICS
jgi:hypothetical protein